MITLYTFGPYFGLPDGSPFVLKAMLLLKFAGLAYREDTGGYGRAPKGKLPYLDDDGVRVADSTFIRFHIEQAHGVDLDHGLSPAERAVSWAVEKMCEDHLYWTLIDARWGNKANFVKGPAQFFAAIPAPFRPIFAELIRRKTVKAARIQGIGRHDRADIERLAIHDLHAITAILGSKPYLMGETPCAADAAVFGSVASALAPLFDTPIRAAAERVDTLVAYRDRMLAEFFPAAP